jgi:hypothetical protein
MDLSKDDLEQISSGAGRCGDVVTSGWEGPTAVDEIDDP